MNIFVHDYISDSYGELTVFLNQDTDEVFYIIDRSDAEWRPEYFDRLLNKLGHNVTNVREYDEEILEKKIIKYYTQ